MAICIVSYVIIAVAFVLRRRIPIPRQVLLVFLVGNTVACILFGIQLWQKESVSEVRREDGISGGRKEEYLAMVEGESEEFLVDVEIAKRQYTAEEVQHIFAEVMEQLDTLILGNNTDFDCIERDLNLVSGVKGYPVQIQWVVSDYQVLDINGAIREEYDEEEGTLVELQGYLSLQEMEAVYVRNVMVYPEKTETLPLKERIGRLLQERERETVTEAYFELPKTIDGKEIRWSRGKDNKGYFAWAMGLVTSILLVLRKKEQKREEKKKKEEEMLHDYPGIISTFTLLLETGMTVKNVWAKMVQNYERHKTQMGERVAYTQMCETYYAMQSGVPEVTAYEQFGVRCGLVQYRKFGALLSQNLRKGSKGLATLLLMESIQATEERKSRMKQKAEEAGTKLLIPMFAMLGVVLIMVVVPAFMSMQI